MFFAMVLTRLLATALLVTAPAADGLLTELQRAIGRDDRQAIATLIQYPMTITRSGVRISVRDTESLLQVYDAVFTPEVKAAIRDGSAIRDGVIQVTPVQGVDKIASISEPARSSPVSGGTTLSRAVRRGPQRVRFATVQQIAQLSGSLSPGQSDSFVAYAEKGCLLEARIDGVRGKDIVLKVVDAKSGKPLDTKAADGTRVWIGRVPESADYRIDVTRLARQGDQWLPYVLVVRRR
jgi:hypothetical protein